MSQLLHHIASLWSARNWHRTYFHRSASAAMTWIGAPNGIVPHCAYNKVENHQSDLQKSEARTCQQQNHRGAATSRDGPWGKTTLQKVTNKSEWHLGIPNIIIGCSHSSTASMKFFIFKWWFPELFSLHPPFPAQEKHVHNKQPSLRVSTVGWRGAKP